MMEYKVPTITVYDKNVYYLLSSRDFSNEPGPAGIFDNLGPGKSMFPTKIKYIFEDDDDQSIESNEENGIDNVIIIDLDNNHSLENVTLLSDGYELLSFKENKLPTPGERSDKQELKDICNEIEIDVISQFRDLSKVSKNLSLDDLIKIYALQNEQIRTISDTL
ncbi:hypothetical protein Kpol_1036p2 [Vanderwaltozyma polyspora DSM 70294]|uniref:Uncharacterized protein n=1 Tax=Vanderwaltozyma polyspora (strain ATCC 22028 / DSM 70294 / BCRC 21397 / CBS 2163 / NBRC 10782 / NRRL Y-8283 / UCD 57-17) TaxID=436907 RepID=A7TEF3_VANPO|nr:uncharacterized protein Kpol_1036p2 [Vanderwaltozyma polyspora DSM 70294]EDO19260.1 hypothetical protein Kpol_1036p2 [Vanderwaltozyma polyspora DSM 70294]